MTTRSNDPIAQKRVFYDTTIREEMQIVADYEERGEKVVGWDRVIAGGLAMFILYLT